MKTEKTRNCLLALLIPLVVIVWVIDCTGREESGARLSNRDMSQIRGKCPCTTAEDCGFDCSGNSYTCTGCSGPCSGTISIAAGTQPKCCDTTGKGKCANSGYVTCKTMILCKATNYDDKNCKTSTETCSGPSSETCDMCSNGDTYPVRRLNQTCNSS